MEHQYMAIDKTKFFSIIKIIAFLIYFAYFAICNSKFNIYLPLHPKGIDSKKEDISTLKKNLPHKISYALIGGSNVQRGLSGEIISSDSNICINYGIDDENGGTTKYFNWLDSMVTANVVVYSPIIIWNDGNNFLGEIQNSKENYFPKISILSQIAAFFSLQKNPDPLNFNSFGDMTDYSCHKNVVNFKINTRSFTLSNDSITKEIIERVNKLKEITKTSKVLVRVAPIYIFDRNKENYMRLMEKRIKILKNAGIIVIENSFTSSDRTLFCDEIHPNQKGRTFFSKELKKALLNYKTAH